MPQRRNEVETTQRPEPFSYLVDTLDSSGGGAIYEAWAAPGAKSTEALWLARKNTYDSNGILVQVDWYQHVDKAV